MDTLTQLFLAFLAMYAFWVYGFTPRKQEQKPEDKIQSLEKEVTVLSQQIEELREHNKYR